MSVALLLLRGELISAARDALVRSLEQVARQERTLLSLGWHSPGTPTGSVSPQPPWRVSGHLSRSVMTTRPRLSWGWRGLAWKGSVGADAVYARIHELSGWTGRGHKTYLPPRPHLRPAWEIARPMVRPVFEHYMEKAISRATSSHR